MEVQRRTSIFEGLPLRQPGGEGLRATLPEGVVVVTRAAAVAGGADAAGPEGAARLLLPSSMAPETLPERAYVRGSVPQGSDEGALPRAAVPLLRRSQVV